MGSLVPPQRWGPKNGVWGQAETTLDKAQDLLRDLVQDAGRGPIAVQEVVALGHEEGLGEEDAVPHGGANRIPLPDELGYMGRDLYPPCTGEVWAGDPDA